MKKLFTLFLALIASVSAIYASDTQVDGIWYDFDESNKTATVTYRGSSFDSYNNEYSGSVVIPSSVTYNGTTYSVTSIGEWAFGYCSSLTSVTIPNSVTSIGSDAFEYCSGLTSVTIPNSVKSIGRWAFFGCSGLTSPVYNAHIFAFMPTSYSGAYTIPDGIESIAGGAFSDYSGLTSVTIPNSVTSIGDAAFYRCTSLTSITIPNSVTSIGRSAFNGCSGLTSPVYNAHCFAYMPTSYSGAYTIPEGIKQIAGGAFIDCSSLTSVTIPNSVTSIGEGAFYNCSSLTSVTIPNSVTSIGVVAFVGTGIYTNAANWENDVLYINDCLTLAKVSISGAYTIKAGTRLIADYAFSGSLTSVTIPNSVTSIGEGAFEGCSNITSVTWNAKNCNSYNFGSQVTSFEFGNEVEVIPSSLCKGMEKLTSISIPNSVTSIGEGAFEGCTNITSVSWNAKNCNSYNFGSQVTSFEFGNEVEVIPSSLCKGLEKLISISIPNSVKTIGVSAFKGCIRLGKITLGNGLENIGANAFAECTRLYDIYVYATYPPFAEESSFANYNVYVYIPCEYQRDYTLDIVWGKFKFIECISSDNVTTDEIVITPSDNEANVTWPTVSGAATYELVIKDKDGNIVCTLIFNANGQLTSIAFNAPSRNGVPAQTQNAGFSFTITGLDSGTGYDLTLTAKDNSGNIIEETTIPFHTDYPEGIDDVQGDEVQSTKVIKDGQVLILRNGKTYTMQGQEVK